MKTQQNLDLRNNAAFLNYRTQNKWPRIYMKNILGNTNQMVKIDPPDYIETLLAKPEKDQKLSFRLIAEKLFEKKWQVRCYIFNLVSDIFNIEQSIKKSLSSILIQLNLTCNFCLFLNMKLVKLKHGLAVSPAGKTI